ncbi:MAG TPA: hypothetical protein VFS73_08945 [Solirubrobacterales bacterium]|jgi:hypothetical protein|nr:hypothetical protein [Solirubrobacterales bacterium]
MEADPHRQDVDPGDDDIRQEEDLDDHADEPAEGEVGPAEDIENDPAYSPEDEGLRQIKGG